MILLFLTAEHTVHAAVLNHLGRFGPECARFGRGVPKKFVCGRNNRGQARIRRARKRKPSAGDRHLGLCHAYLT